MKKYDDFISGLQQDMDVPGNVWLQYINTLENIEQLADQRREEEHMRKHQKAIRKTWVKVAAVAGVLAVSTMAVSYADPVSASKLPIIGRIFEQVEDDTTYSGDYGKKTVLKEEKQEPDAAAKINQGQGNVYQASDQGITITASEVYCDGYSVYLAAKIEAEEGGFSNIPAHYTRRFEDKTSKSIHAEGTWKIDADGKETGLCNHTFEGKAIDDHTFIGMMKLDQDQYSDSDGQLQLELSEFLYDDEAAMNGESIEPQHRIEGIWKLTVPFTVDTEQSREIPVNKENADGYHIQKVFVSPYQVIVFSDTPYTTLSPETYTKEDFEEQWGTKNGEISAHGEEAVTYEEVLAQKFYDYYELAVFNQDGEALEMQFGDETRTVFAVQEHELSKLHIYAGDESHAMELVKATNEQEAKEKSVMDVEIDL